MSPYGSVLEDEELIFEDELEDIDESAFEDTDESFEDDGFSERRRGRRSRRPGRVRVGPTPQGRGYVKPRLNGGFATQAALHAGLARVGRDIRANGEAIKRAVAQVNKVTADIGTVNARQDTEISDLRKEIRKGGDAGKNQGQLMMLLTLLQKPPELEAKSNLTAAQKTAADTALGLFQVKKQDNTLPLIIMMMGAGGLGGGSSSDSMSMMLPLLLLMDK